MNVMSLSNLKASVEMLWRKVWNLAKDLYRKIKDVLMRHKWLRVFLVITGVAIIVGVAYATGFFGLLDDDTCKAMGLDEKVVHASSQFRDVNGDGRTVVTIDAGHGFNTAGKRIHGYTGSPLSNPDGTVREWQMNNEVTNRIMSDLKAQGIEVIRVDDPTGAIDISLDERLNRIVAAKSDLHLSIHHNALGNDVWSNATGVETYYSCLRPESQKLAQSIADRLSASVGLKNRGVKSNAEWNLFMTREPGKRGIDTVLVEGGFMDGTNDIPIISSYEGMQGYAKAVVDSVLEYLKCNITMFKTYMSCVGRGL